MRFAYDLGQFMWTEMLWAELGSSGIPKLGTFTTGLVSNFVGVHRTSTSKKSIELELTCSTFKTKNRANLCISQKKCLIRGLFDAKTNM